MSDIDVNARFEALRGARCQNFPAYSGFGRNDYGFDNGGVDGDGECDDDEGDFGDQSPGHGLVTTAVALFAAGWQRFDVETTAVVFNLAPALIEAVAPDRSEWDGKDPTDDSHFDRLVQLVGLLRYQSDDGPCTVAEIAALLNVREEAVITAVEGHYWMFLGDERDGSPTIEHEGE